MTLVQRSLNTILSIASGAVVGFTLGFYGPWVVAMTRNDDPIHRGHYGDWIEVLILVGPILVGGIVGALAWYDRLRALRVVVHILALIGIAWQVYLLIGQ
jgi:hypothetical protein